MNILPFEVRVRALSALVEGNSIRSTERMVGVHRDSIMRLGVVAGNGCARLHDRLVRDLNCSTIEMDEIWSFVGKKQKRLTEQDPVDFGDQYVFVALDANTKLVISYVIGKRSAQSTNMFLADVRRRVLNRPQITSDGFSPYVDAVERAFGVDVDFAQLVKEYKGDSAPDAARRYSPGWIIGAKKTPIVGAPDPAKISTSYVERQNLTMRMQMRRFTRLTNGFSKKLPNLCAATALHFAHYNFCRVHETLRVTPAVAAGLTDHIWSLAELLAAAITTEPSVPPVAPPPAQRERPALRMIHGGRGG